MDLAKKLVYLRKEKGMTQLKLAETLNLSRQAISRWEVGEATPSTENLKSLSDLYGVPLEYLLNDDKQELERKADSPTEERNINSQTHRHNWKMMAVLAVIVLGLLAVLLIHIATLEEHRENKISMLEIEGEEIETESERDFDLEW